MCPVEKILTHQREVCHTLTLSHTFDKIRPFGNFHRDQKRITDFADLCVNERERERERTTARREYKCDAALAKR